MRSTLNLLIVVCLLLFTLACGLVGDESGNDQNSSVNSTQNGSENAESQGIPVDNGQIDNESAGDSGTRSGDNTAQQGEDKIVNVRFRKGSTSGTYRDTVHSGYKHVYSFGVVRDQNISVRLSSGDRNAYLKIVDPAGEPISLSGDSTSFSESVPQSGKYKIEVLTLGDSSDYTITFSASALPNKEDDVVRSGGGTKTVRFAKGRSSASYRGAVIRGESDTYVLGASAGQQMSVSISSVEANAVFQIEGPNGYLRGAEPGTDRTSWSGQLPASGRYRVIVGPTRGNATYSITFSIR